MTASIALQQRGQDATRRSGPAGLAVAAIGWYQRRISPRKGFRCAYGVAWGCGTCSSIVKAGFSSYGMLRGTRIAIEQLFRCHAAAVHLNEMPPEPKASSGSKDKVNHKEWAAAEGAWFCAVPFIN